MVQFVRDFTVIYRYQAINTLHLVLMLLRVPGTRHKEFLETVFRCQDVACPLLDTTLRRCTMRRGACMWALVTMDPLDDYRLVFSLDDLATSTLHGICSVIGVLNISRLLHFKFTKKSGLLPLLFLYFTQTSR